MDEDRMVRGRQVKDKILILIYDQLPDHHIHHIQRTERSRRNAGGRGREKKSGEHRSANNSGVLY